MEAIILTVAMIALASFLTFNHTTENEKKINQKTQVLTKSQATNQNNNSEKAKEPPYYERFISRNRGDNFLDYSGGMMGI